jgi:hypothetical protein
VTGFKEIAPLRLEALLVAEEQDGDLRPVAEVRFGFAGRQLCSTLDPLRTGAADRHGAVPVRPAVRLRVKHFGRHRGGAIRDGVVVAVSDPG